MCVTCVLLLLDSNTLRLTVGGSGFCQVSGLRFTLVKRVFGRSAGAWISAISITSPFDLPDVQNLVFNPDLFALVSTFAGRNPHGLPFNC